MTPTHRVVSDPRAGGYYCAFEIGDLVEVTAYGDDGNVIARRVTDDMMQTVPAACLEEIVREEPTIGVVLDQGAATWEGLPAFEDLPLGYALGVAAYLQGAIQALMKG